jgi:adenylate kinase family enzyme
MRTAIIGNSGSGKTTLAKALAHGLPIPILDLDTIYWEPGKLAVERPAPARLNDLNVFCRRQPSWIVEGCYADLIEASLSWRPELILLNPGLDVCVSHCRSRAFEPQKWRSKAEQDRGLEFLLKWVEDYYQRKGPMSWEGHLELFERYDGPKRQIRTVIDFPAERTGSESDLAHDK